MRHSVAVWLFCFLASILAFGQDVPRAEVFVGYSYINADTNGLTSRLNMNGADVSFVANFNQWAGAETNFSTYYKHLNLGGTGVSVRDFNIAFGPRLHYKWAFVHALAGLDDFGGSALGLSSTNGAFGAAIGGGVVFKITRRIGLEGGGDYLVTRHNLLLGSAVTQNHVRAIAGVVFTFGSVGASAEQVPQATPAPVGSQRIAPRAAGAGMSIPALGIRAVPESSQGAMIASEEPNGIAALAGLHAGDVINSVDGKPVKSPAELAAALSELPSGAKVRLGFMIHGEWQTGAVIILP
jgi:hypothetical protein